MHRTKQFSKLIMALKYSTNMSPIITDLSKIGLTEFKLSAKKNNLVLSAVVIAQYHDQVKKVIERYEECCNYYMLNELNLSNIILTDKQN